MRSRADAGRMRPGRPVFGGRKRGRLLGAPGGPGVDVARGFRPPLGTTGGGGFDLGRGIARVLGRLRGGGRRVGPEGTLRVALLAGIPAAGPGVVPGPAGARGRRVGQGRVAAGDVGGIWKSVRVAGFSSDSTVAGSLLSTPPPGGAVSQPAAKVATRAAPRPSTPRVVKRRFIAGRLPGDLRDEAGTTPGPALAVGTGSASLNCERRAAGRSGASTVGGEVSRVARSGRTGSLTRGTAEIYPPSGHHPRLAARLRPPDPEEGRHHVSPAPPPRGHEAGRPLRPRALPQDLEEDPGTRDPHPGLRRLVLRDAGAGALPGAGLDPDGAALARHQGAVGQVDRRRQHERRRAARRP